MEQCLKRQKNVIHGFEARALKYIPKLVYRICERLLILADCKPIYDVHIFDFTKAFLAYKYDVKNHSSRHSRNGIHHHHVNVNGHNSSSGNGMNGGSSGASELSTPSDSMMATRRSSKSMLLGTGNGSLDSSDGSLVGTPKSSFNSRPDSETNSYIQSCSSALSGVDDRRLDEILADGIRNQDINENRVTRELASHEGLVKQAQNQKYPTCSPSDIYEALMDNHVEVLRRDGVGNTSPPPEEALAHFQYRSDLNFKLSSWDRIETETDLFVLTSLLLEWLEHLKSPVLDRDGITYIVIRADDVEAALRKLPNHLCYIVEYLIRFVARLQPLPRQHSENLLRRFMAALTHQSTIIDGKSYPIGKKFPKLRGGTGDSTIKFMMLIFDSVAKPNVGNQLAENDRFRSMAAESASAKMMKRPNTRGGHYANNGGGTGSVVSLDASVSSTSVNVSASTSLNVSTNLSVRSAVDTTAASSPSPVMQMQMFNVDAIVHNQNGGGFEIDEEDEDAKIEEVHRGRKTAKAEKDDLDRIVVDDDEDIAMREEEIMEDEQKIVDDEIENMERDFYIS